MPENGFPLPHPTQSGRLLTTAFMSTRNLTFPLWALIHSRSPLSPHARTIRIGRLLTTPHWNVLVSPHVLLVLYPRTSCPL